MEKAKKPKTRKFSSLFTSNWLSKLVSLFIAMGVWYTIFFPSAEDPTRKRTSGPRDYPDSTDPGASQTDDTDPFAGQSHSRWRITFDRSLMSNKKRILFGTDGIRGKAGIHPLNAATVLKLGQSAADVLLSKDNGGNWPVVVIGKDTRQSGDMLEAAIAAGLNSRGSRCEVGRRHPHSCSRATDPRAGVPLSES